MSDLRIFFLIVSFSFVLTSAVVHSSTPFEVALSKFEVYDSILESIEQRILQQLMKIKNDLLNIQAENSTSFECVGLYGDLIPLNQLRTSFHMRIVEYQNRKAGYLTLNSNVSFH